MHLQLRLRMAECGQAGDGGELARAQVQPRTAVHITEAELDHVAREVGGNVFQRIDHVLAGLAVDLGEALATSCVAFVVHLESFPFSA